MSSHADIRVYTIAEVAELLRISPWKVGNLCRTGRIRASKVAESWRITDDAVREFLTATEQQRGGDAA